MSDMIERVDALERRVKQLEEAILAIATGQSIGLTVDGFIVAKPLAKPIYTGSQRGHDFVG